MNTIGLANVEPAFFVEELDPDDLVEHKQFKYEAHKDDITGKVTHRRIETIVKEPPGFMVYFPKGHCIRIRTNEELVAMGYGGPAEMIDMDSGEVVPMGTPITLKDKVAKKTKPASRTRNSGVKE